VRDTLLVVADQALIAVGLGADTVALLEGCNGRLSRKWAMEPAR
jgi:hypothetical protein